jgi:hypothetical protein
MLVPAIIAVDVPDDKIVSADDTIDVVFAVLVIPPATVTTLLPERRVLMLTDVRSMTPDDETTVVVPAPMVVRPVLVILVVAAVLVFVPVAVVVTFADVRPMFPDDDTTVVVPVPMVVRPVLATLVVVAARFKPVDAVIATDVPAVMAVVVEEPREIVLAVPVIPPATVIISLPERMVFILTDTISSAPDEETSVVVPVPMVVRPPLVMEELVVELRLVVSAKTLNAEPMLKTLFPVIRVFMLEPVMPTAGASMQNSVPTSKHVLVPETTLYHVPVCVCIFVAAVIPILAPEDTPMVEPAIMCRY